MNLKRATHHGEYTFAVSPTCSGPAILCSCKAKNTINFLLCLDAFSSVDLLPSSVFIGFSSASSLLETTSHSAELLVNWLPTLNTWSSIYFLDMGICMWLITEDTPGEEAGLSISRSCRFLTAGDRLTLLASLLSRSESSCLILFWGLLRDTGESGFLSFTLSCLIRSRGLLTITGEHWLLSLAFSALILEKEFLRRVGKGNFLQDISLRVDIVGGVLLWRVERESWWAQVLMLDCHETSSRRSRAACPSLKKMWNHYHYHQQIPLTM